jgi:4-aminobutyrate aminotransferase/(S)-3-amino-2-methylpropionate transaminase
VLQALAVLDVIKDENILAHSNDIGTLLGQHLHQLKTQYPSYIGDVRQIGTMLAIELIEQGDIHQPNIALTQAIIANAAVHGLILLACGFHVNVFGFLLPLTIEQHILEQCIAKFK